MDMQDRDFDELFRSRLEDFEQEPSARVWEDITGGLAPARKKRRVPTWLSIAASLLVALGAWAVFAGRNQEASVPAKRPIAGVVHKKEARHTSPVSPAIVKPGQNEIAKAEKQYARVKPKKSATNIGNSGLNTKEPATQNIAPASASPTNQPVAIANAFVPDDVQLAVKSAADIKFNAKADPLADQAPVFSKRDTAAAVKRKHKIHNFGDLVNLVVDKLDKRKDKLIVFSSDDENDERITGVNLGVVKAKKGE
jgi:hypothetical protein